MALNAVHLNGLQIANDNGAITSFTGKALSIISGGGFVYVGSIAASVSSGLNSLVFGDIEIGAPASGANFAIGVAYNNAASGAAVTVLRSGFQMISTAAGTIIPGDIVLTPDNNTLLAGSQTTYSSEELQQVVGRALTGAASGGYCLHTVNFI